MRPAQVQAGAGGVRGDAVTAAGSAAVGSAAGACGGGPLAGALGRLQSEVGARSRAMATVLQELAAALDSSAATYLGDDGSAAGGLGSLMLGPLMGPR